MRWLAVDYQRDYARPTRSRRTRPATEQASAAAPALDERRQGAGRIGAIEGIRTLSIVAILLYHADPSWLPGGFFGVSVFFVLTGYLTTISLERERSNVREASTICASSCDDWSGLFPPSSSPWA